jgi:RNA polymerase sigma-70 factor (ECF subfamily)
LQTKAANLRPRRDGPSDAASTTERDAMTAAALNDRSEHSKTLAQLLARTALRDQAAFTRLYELTSAHLYAAALRILKRPAWAEDVLQESFINIWQRAETYAAEKSQPMTWLTSIVRNRALDWLRRPVPDSVAIDEDEEEWVIADEGPTPLELLVSSAQARNVRDCLGSLDAPQQQSIALAFYQGLSHSELARHLGEPLGTVKSWIRRALEKLQHCLEAS